MLLLFIGITAAFTSCKKEDKPQQPQQQSIVGTKWTTSFSDDMIVIEFTSSNEVIGYFANSGGGIIWDVVRGTYTKSGNSITFHNLTLKWIYAYYELQSGTVSGSVLTTRGRETFNIESSNWYSWNETWTKK